MLDCHTTWWRHTTTWLVQPFLFLWSLTLWCHLEPTLGLKKEFAGIRDVCEFTANYHVQRALQMSRGPDVIISANQSRYLPGQDLAGECSGLVCGCLQPSMDHTRPAV